MALPSGQSNCPLADRVHGLDSGDGPRRAPERLEAKHGPRDSLDRAVVLFYDVV
jgi:hypothetical protein